MIDGPVLERHGLTRDEYERIVQFLGRTPNITELGIFSVMWSEHCSYKSSRVHLKTLPTEGPQVLQGPGENAGALDIGDGLAAVFKIESHNHPSFIEPYQGAATGVGGIIRDIFTMGARPIALLNSLRFGSLDAPGTRRLLEGVVAGIAGYGNSIGIPTVGGEIAFEPSYAGNPLVNVFCLGIAAASDIIKGVASGAGNAVYYVGAKSGREADVERIFDKWDLHASRIGEVTTDGMLRVKDRGAVVAEIPNRALTDEAPVYRRPLERPEYLAEVQPLDLDALAVRPASVASSSPSNSDLLALLASPTIGSKRWVYRQYDHMVRTNTLNLPGFGAGVVRVKGTDRGLALSVDGNGRYCYLDPYRGAMLAVAESARNVACAGARPLGATNCLNFGNPERPALMWQLAKAVEGIGAACRALDVPITGGNVSLYNETDGRAIYPTPVIGVVGLLVHADRVVSRRFRETGDAILLLGEGHGELGGSEYLKVMHDLVRGVPPALDLDGERA